MSKIDNMIHRAIAMILTKFWSHFYGYADIFLCTDDYVNGNFTKIQIPSQGNLLIVSGTLRSIYKSV